MSPSGINIKQKRIESIKNWLELQSIREIFILIGFANFYRRFIQDLNTIARLFLWKFKTNLGLKASKLAKKGIITSSCHDSASLLILNAKKSFQKLK